ncbi:hypothetical protein ACFOOP_19730 [Marinicaulis aureus]|uniref:Uncharacterized protein n=1 Tax=Hyphococcus aureus TaxID=2666033 RepID=A0ABW1L0V9_9PROT
MDLILRLLTSSDLPKERSRDFFALEEGVRSSLKTMSFKSPKQTFGVWVVALPPNDLRPPEREEVKVDRRDGVVSTTVIGDFDAYKSAKPSEAIDLFVLDVIRALRQVPEKFLLVEDREKIIEILKGARIEFYKTHFEGKMPKDLTVDMAASSRANINEEEKIQIVVQFDDATPLPENALENYSEGEKDDIFALEELLEKNSGDTYEVDGHDFGSGTVNIFLYCINPDPAVRRLLSLIDSHKLMPEIRIGIADTGRGRLRAVYPPELREFDLINKP